ncbi:MAG: U32 family peptidase [Bacteroidales bacterium]|nr:U32 family peptidase [Bacteroidales bacterium]
MARELSLEQIRNIRNQTSIELEFFVHGALCVCYSGQCYFSHAITGRSANRGECSQPCRSAYNLLDAQGNGIIRNKHLLSLKDLNLSDHLADLAEAGITSFKIEGRLKDIDYVKNITLNYRRKLDALIEGSTLYRKASVGKVYATFTPQPEKSFYRGGTNYFITGRNKNLITFSTQKSIGEPIGLVKRINKQAGSFILETGKIINANDGLCFLILIMFYAG